MDKVDIQYIVSYYGSPFRLTRDVSNHPLVLNVQDNPHSQMWYDRNGNLYSKSFLHITYKEVENGYLLDHLEYWLDLYDIRSSSRCPSG